MTKAEMQNYIEKQACLIKELQNEIRGLREPSAGVYEPLANRAERLQKEADTILSGLKLQRQRRKDAFIAALVHSLDSSIRSIFYRAEGSNTVQAVLVALSEIADETYEPNDYPY